MNVTGEGAAVQGTQCARAIGSVGGFIDPGRPNLADFRNFLATEVQIPCAALPATSPWPEYALQQAQALINFLPGVPGVISSIATYNGATHILLSITPDQPGQNFFVLKRSKQGFSLVNPSTGLIASTSDESTSSSVASLDWARTLTADQLDFYKTPWGRYYLSFQQKYGPSIVGLT